MIRRETSARTKGPNMNSAGNLHGTVGSIGRRRSRRYQTKFKAEKVSRSLNNVLSNSNRRAKRAKKACIQKHDELYHNADGKFRMINKNPNSELSTDEENKENRKAIKKISETRMNNRKPLKCSTRVQLLRKRGLPSSSPVLSSPSSSSLSSLSSTSSSSSLSSISSASSRPTSSESSASRSSSSSLSSSSTISCSDEDTESDESCHCGDV
ncbi:putative uncharacterized protein DDB_G0277255 [Odontomachus brunneus]|uniref:putative uncharacterized protein DDB_G0277255 n=1 Tax=Odontomachus brunneus TaxID=486640 RepID=UPI0013F21921|nr:putative uncharacterized protein DDB_G0277255 [Odontomachus brunneus]